MCCLMSHTCPGRVSFFLVQFEFSSLLLSSISVRSEFALSSLTVQVTSVSVILDLSKFSVLVLDLTVCFLQIMHP